MSRAGPSGFQHPCPTVCFDGEEEYLGIMDYDGRNPMHYHFIKRLQAGELPCSDTRLILLLEEAATEKHDDVSLHLGYHQVESL